VFEKLSVNQDRGTAHPYPLSSAAVGHNMIKSLLFHPASSLTTVAG
jgi:hypothetical protein